MPILPGRFSSCLASMILIGSARKACTHEVGAAEERVFRLFNDAPDEIELPVWAVMQSGSLAGVFVVAGELLRQRRNHAAAASLITGVAVWGGVKLAKPLVGRGRPEHHLDGVSVRGQAQTGLGYPSGHAAVALTLALTATSDTSKTVRAVATAVAGCTGGARMYAGAHLPLDVVGGYAIGLLVSRLAAVLTDWEDGN
jgi:membrane-associated phospholipid phosphatase